MSGFELFEDYKPLRKPLGASKREEIEAVIEHNPGMGLDELEEVFGHEIMAAYFSNPDARGLDHAA